MKSSSLSDQVKDQDDGLRPPQQNSSSTSDNDLDVQPEVKKYDSGNNSTHSPPPVDVEEGRLLQSDYSVKKIKVDDGSNDDGGSTIIGDDKNNSNNNNKNNNNGDIQIDEKLKKQSSKPSLVYRRLPVSKLLRPTIPFKEAAMSVLSGDKKIEKEYRNMEDKIARKFCLNPRFTLKTQMMISFGSLNVIIILLVVIICVVMTQWIGLETNRLVRKNFDETISKAMQLNGKYLADAFNSAYVMNDKVDLVHDVIQDRFEGYPNPSDDKVPFFDMETNTNIYPIIGEPMPIRWDVQSNTNEDNYEEFVDSRWKYFKNISVDTTNAGFSFQGSCDPSETNSSGVSYGPNCTDANNNIQTGGVVAPSEETEMYHRKGSDLVPILRALFETREQVREIHISFLNNGAGATIIYPHYARNHQLDYISEGCEWLLSQNPNKNWTAIGNETMLQNCHKKNETVSNFQYNAMERNWCRKQALSPNLVHIETKKYENFRNDDSIYSVSIQPIPLIPEDFDESYRPSFFFVGSFNKEESVKRIMNIEDGVESRMLSITKYSTVLGAVGIIFAIIIIFVMAYILTSPLTNMNRVAADIADSFGDLKKEDEIRQTGDVLVIPRCTPKTELTDVVCEFNKMVTTFSGSSEAKTEKHKDDCILNNFPARNDLMKIYENRNNKLFKYNPTGEHMISSASYLHLGPNHNFSAVITENIETNDILRSKSRKWSPLFFWILLLIVTPLFFIPVAISAVAMRSLINEYGGIKMEVQTLYLSIFKEQTWATTQLRSEYVSLLTEKAIDDLSIFSRYSGWLLFGSVNRSNSFTRVSSAMDECKTFSSDFSQCNLAKTEYVCDCRWQERGYEDTCTNFTESIRHREVNYWMAEVSETGTGDRNSTDFPNSSISPETTNWWKDPMSVPGFQKGSSASGYNTTYDRLRVMSAVPIFQTLQNYRSGASPQATLKVAIAFEADGMFFLYAGCDSVGLLTLSKWRSTVENKAAELRPKLCPVGKYGYDPRCRGWYEDGKNLAISNGADALLVTAPYEFAEDTHNIYGQTATNAIMDPITREYIGQTMVDFNSEYINKVLIDETTILGDGFPVLITPNIESGDNLEFGDVVIGPGEDRGVASQSITSVVMTHDLNCASEQEDECKARLIAFEVIVASMKEGNSSHATGFNRTTKNGETETLSISFAPTHTIGVQSINSSDYARGVRKNELLVYSLGFVTKEKSLLEDFSGVMEEMKQYVRITIGVLAAVIFFGAITSVFISRRLAKSFAATMNYLLRLLRHINTQGEKKTPPPTQNIRASHETVVLSKTLQTLYRIVKYANIAFFAGDLDHAYTILVDALSLFRRLDNKKAIGIASNNLGNTLLSVYREMKMIKKDEIDGLTINDAITQGISHFHTAIKLGEKAYDEFYEIQGWSPVCLNFMQHLANRYFNRGMFLLIVKNDHNDPKEIEKLGMRDLKIADDMDQEIVAFGEDIGWGGSERVDIRFNVNILRIRGYNTLLGLGYDDNDNDWGVQELIQDTLGIIKDEYRKSQKSNLFTKMSCSGRLQELEMQLMRYKLHHNDLETAAKIAVRLLVEDEYVFVEAIRQAVKVLIQYIETDDIVPVRSMQKP
ncbi:hypothetical protein FRACYDRAFT_266147 [Fragilariopsis cylindrus CCMP1102]|uniref:Uncharacterized protein n=1 Tax=Fragilariopsis cylindrus CCMP1102 TaxID=635003 RepID=A0A1E7EK62_9STRA|nr:hypothetical protein FRACYDRAFT_266147 [Fragilariopsis cylindrus CCMP1102]|eukprot:OEU06276.1 hypothetical protein FRACYDRAFT_266147 [Fragilariopsis cylindrus CCMP1102]